MKFAISCHCLFDNVTLHFSVILILCLAVLSGPPTINKRTVFNNFVQLRQAFLDKAVLHYQTSCPVNFYIFPKPSTTWSRVSNPAVNSPDCFQQFLDHGFNITRDPTKKCVQSEDGSVSLTILRLVECAGCYVCNVENKVRTCEPYCGNTGVG